MSDHELHPVRGSLSPADGGKRNTVKTVGLFVGAAAFLTIMLIPPPDGLSGNAWRVAALAALMAIWWLTEALPVAATALLPIAVLPVLGIVDATAAAAPYAHPLIFLFFGGFVIALAMERWGLDRRVALVVLRACGTRPTRLIGGFMIASAGLSMWVSNTATTVMMLPIGLSVIALLGTNDDASEPAVKSPFALSLLLGIAYGASIGGLATLIGTPPNALLAAFMAKTYGIEIGFGRWMLLGLPLSCGLLLVAWLILTRVAFRPDRTPIRGASAVLSREFQSLGPLSRAEKRVGIVFALVALAWVFRPVISGLVPGLTDPGIAILGALALFIVPADARRGHALMNWAWAKRLPWSILVLFGGGLSLASAIQSSGLAAWLGQGLMAAQGWPLIALVLVVTAVVIFMTELTSNTAATAIFLPIIAAFATSMSLSPLMLAVPAALAASCAFMLPVATPPNAVIFSSGHVTIPTMARAGILLNLIAIAAIVAAAYSLLGLVFEAAALG